MPAITFVRGAAPADADATVLIAPPYPSVEAHLALYAEAVAAAAIDKAFTAALNVIPAAAAAGGRLVFSPTGPLRRDYDDVRRVAEAVTKGVQRALKAGASKPHLVLPSELLVSDIYAKVLQVALTAALNAAYVPFSIRSATGELPCARLGALSVAYAPASDDDAARDIALAQAVVAGQLVTKDIGGSDPEIMAPIKAADYLTAAFAGSPVAVTVEADVEGFKKEYPLLHAVARCSLAVPRHHPRVVRLEYNGEGPITRQVYMIGKGIVYDTGGADVKTGGHMAGMSRDKVGAAAAAGFFKSLAELKPRGVRAVALLAFVRNSIGADSYVSDEIIVSRAGVRVMVMNTDAEGRMVMTDLLAKAREEITAQDKAARPPTVVHTIATLTGHAVIAAGPGYSIAVDNGPARAMGVSAALAAGGHLVADPFELSSLRREDFEIIAPKTAEYDVKQGNTLPSVSTPRGHQFPAAFMAIASKLTDHGIDGADPIAYTHLDIAGSSVAAPFLDGVVTGQPVAALVQAYAL